MSANFAADTVRGMDSQIARRHIASIIHCMMPDRYKNNKQKYAKIKLVHNSNRLWSTVVLITVSKKDSGAFKYSFVMNITYNHAR